MHIIIDGYNLIRRSPELRRHERHSLEEGRRALIRALTIYRRLRPHRITLVFDGNVGGAPQMGRDREGDILILYSPRGVTADEVIRDLAERRDGETVVVTSDRAVASFVERRGATVVSADQFAEILLAPGRGGREGRPGESETPEKEEDDDERERPRKGPARRPSRRERELRKKLEKL